MAIMKAVGLGALVLGGTTPKVHVLLHRQRERTRSIAVVKATVSKEGLGRVGQSAWDGKFAFQEELLVVVRVRARKHRVEWFRHWWCRMGGLGLLVSGPVFLHAPLFDQGGVSDCLEATIPRAVFLFDLNGPEAARQT